MNINDLIVAAIESDDGTEYRTVSGEDLDINPRQYVGPSNPLGVASTTVRVGDSWAEIGDPEMPSFHIYADDPPRWLPATALVVNLAPTLNITGTADLSTDQTAYLDANQGDDGLPNPPAAMTALWSQVSGPDDAVYKDPTWFRPHVTFPVAGTYVLRCTISDGDPAIHPGALSTAQDWTVTVTAAGSTQPPTITVSGPTYITTADGGLLVATATDSGGAALTYAWTVESSPGGSQVTFDQPATATTAVSVDTVGSYTFRCTADNGVLNAFDDVIVEAVVDIPSPTPGLPTTIQEANGGFFPNGDRDNPSVDRELLLGTPRRFISDWVQRAGWGGWETDVTNKIPLVKGNDLVYVIGIPPIVKGGPTLAQGINGNFDIRYQHLADTLATLNNDELSRIAIRWGWEFNGSWYPWEVKSQVSLRTDFKNLWIKVWNMVDSTLNAAGKTGRPLWVYNTAGGHGAPGNNPTQAAIITESYPGSQYVDRITFDIYSNYQYKSNAPSASGFGVGWDNARSQVIDWHVAFAQNQGKPIGVDEWSTEWKVDGTTQQGGDDYPGFARGMFAWANEMISQGQLCWLCLFDNDTGKNSLFASLSRKNFTTSPTADRTGPEWEIPGVTDKNGNPVLSNMPNFAAAVIDEMTP